MSRFAFSKTLTALLLVVALAGCDKEQSRRGRPAEKTGVVGRVVSVQGKVTYTEKTGGSHKPLNPGDPVRAEWTVHTGADGHVSVRLRNGHLWSMGEDLSRKVSTIKALTLAPVKQTTLDKVASLGDRSTPDRNVSAGRHQERTAGSEAPPTRPIKAEDKRKPRPRKARPKRATRRAELDEIDTQSLRARGGLGGGSRLSRRPASRTRTSSPPPVRTPAPAEEKPKTEREGESPTAGAKPPRPATLSGGQIKAVMKQARPGLLRCLTHYQVHGQVTLIITIRGPTGRVTSVRVAGRKATDPVRVCISNSLKTVAFPKFNQRSQTFRYGITRP